MYKENKLDPDMASKAIEAFRHIKPCPFCGCKLSEYPFIMLVSREYTQEMVQWKHERGEFIGNNDYRVYCPRCGARGNSSPFKGKAIEAWNKRTP